MEGTARIWFTQQQTLKGFDPMSALPPKADIGACPQHVCFTPESGHWDSFATCPLCARNRHSARV